MLELRAAIQKAIAGDPIVVATSVPSALRQRFYRYRQKIRADQADPLNLLVDNVHFEQFDDNLIIRYVDPTLHIQELDR